MDEASEQLDLDRRIARVRQLGGTPIVSFGGQANTELAVACHDAEDLYDAYRSVVTRYEVQVIDVDVEGESLADASANDRRAEALAHLQGEQDLSIWVTLPVSPDGLTEDGAGLLSLMLAAGVDLAGVNAMTMNYSGSKDADQSMAEASIEALESTHAQLSQLYEDAGRHLSPAQVWRRIGATPMLGQNDVAGEVFGLKDAERLHEFASEHALGRISMWSLNRDRACSGNYPDVAIVSDSCSGVDQAEAAFSATLGTALHGAPEASTTTSPAADPTATPTDDPATSPYPIWAEDAVYQAGDRVVWRQNVYAAKWWTPGELPDDPTIAESASAWSLIGPVLPGETPEPTPTVPAGTYPEWQPDVAYSQGDRVRFEKVAYVALWWTQGDPPDGPSTADSPAPWRLLTAAEARHPRVRRAADPLLQLGARQPQDPAGDDQLLDLLGALEDVEDLGVAGPLLQQLGLAVADGAAQLDAATA